MKNKAVGTSQLFLGILLFIIGVLLACDSFIFLGFSILAIACIPTYKGIINLITEAPTQHNYKKDNKNNAPSKPLGSLLACIDLTIIAIDEALEKKSKHAYKKSTSRLDYSIYWFFKSYYIICSAQNEPLAEAYSIYFLDRLKEHYLSRLSGRRIDDIIDNRLKEYQGIVYNSETTKELAESLGYAIEQHIIKDLWFPDLVSDAIAVTDPFKQLEVTVEITSMNDYIFTKVGKMYDELIVKWKK